MQNETQTSVLSGSATNLQIQNHQTMTKQMSKFGYHVGGGYIGIVEGTKSAEHRKLPERNEFADSILVRSVHDREGFVLPMGDDSESLAAQILRFGYVQVSDLLEILESYHTRTEPECLICLDGVWDSMTVYGWTRVFSLSLSQIVPLLQVFANKVGCDTKHIPYLDAETFEEVCSEYVCRLVEIVRDLEDSGVVRIPLWDFFRMGIGRFDTRTETVQWLPVREKYEIMTPNGPKTTLRNVRDVNGHTVYAWQMKMVHNTNTENGLSARFAHMVGNEDTDNRKENYQNRYHTDGSDILDYADIRYSSTSDEQNPYRAVQQKLDYPTQIVADDIPNIIQSVAENNPNAADILVRMMNGEIFKGGSGEYRRGNAIRAAKSAAVRMKNEKQSIARQNILIEKKYMQKMSKLNRTA